MTSRMNFYLTTQSERVMRLSDYGFSICLGVQQRGSIKFYRGSSTIVTSYEKPKCEFVSSDYLDENNFGYDESGVLICLECKRSMRFNSGNPAVWHEEECSKHGEITYILQGFIGAPRGKNRGAIGWGEPDGTPSSSENVSEKDVF